MVDQPTGWSASIPGWSGSFPLNERGQMSKTKIYVVKKYSKAYFSCNKVLNINIWGINLHYVERFVEW
jgi:hypothetical protein